MSTSTVEVPKVVSEKEWLKARVELLTKEKEFTRQRDALSRERQKMPWTKVEKNYVFDGPKGKVTLGELFDGRSQLVVYHFMLGPGWAAGCPSCSMLADGFDGAAVHLANRDVTLAAISRATLPEIEAFKKRMRWRFKWVSSNASEFNRDYHVSFTREEVERGETYYNFGKNPFPQEEGPGASVFYKDEAGNTFHTYSSFARGLDHFLTPYNFLDITPRGRHEEGLTFSMAWVKHHDKYEDPYFDDAKKAGGDAKAAHSCCGGNETHR
jgi:predicted dithiol-disulfide oxidoreductase (DUF899 family)